MTTTTSRRAILAGAALLPAASLPAIAAPAAATGHDPAFATVERFKRAWDELGKVVQSEPTLPDGRPASGTAEYDAWSEVKAAVGNEQITALEKMLATRPTTNAGAAAIIRVYAETHGELDSEFGQALLESLHSFLSGDVAVQS